MFTLMPPRLRKQRNPATTETPVYFQDEAPRIGAGWRLVQLLTIGRKWATFRELASRHQGAPARATWGAISDRGNKLS